MTNPTIRAWQEGDEAALADALGEPDPQMATDRALLGPDSARPWRHTVVAEAGGAVVGAASLTESGLHPQRLWLYAEVAPAHRRLGVGTALVRAVREADPPSGVTAVKVRYAVGPDGGGAAAGFAAALGLVPIQRSRQVRVSAGALTAPVFGPVGPALEDLATGSVELTRAAAAFYDAVHAGWDPSQMSLGRAQDHLLSPAAGARGAVVLRDRPRENGGRILAFAISYETAEDATSEVLLGYDPALDPARARSAVHNLLAMVAARYPVLLEVDDAMEPVGSVLAPLLASGAATVERETEIAATPA